jgi:hypothetical protein
MSYCQKCGKNLAISERLCPNCGYKFKSNKLKYFFVVAAIIIIVAAFYFLNNVDEEGGDPRISSYTRDYLNCVDITFQCYITHMDEVYDWEDYCDRGFNCEGKFEPYMDLIHQDMINAKEYFCEFNTALTLRLSKKIRSSNIEFEIPSEDEVYLDCLEQMNRLEKQMEGGTDQDIEGPIDYAVSCKDDTDCPARRPYCDTRIGFCVKEPTT